MTADPAAPIRRLALAAWALTVVFGVVLGTVAVHGSQPPAWDLALHAAAVGHRPAPLTAVASGLSATTEALAYAPAAAGGLLALRSRHRWLGLLAGAAALAVGQLVRFGLSVAVGRARPPRGDWAGPASGFAFPSGHTTTAALAAGLLCLGLIRAVRGTWRAVGVVVAGAWAVAVGLARVYLGVHWPTDVLGGWLLGALLTVLAALLLAWPDLGGTGARGAEGGDQSGMREQLQDGDDRHRRG